MTALLAASRAVRLPDATRRRRGGWPVAFSVLLHAGLLLLALIAARHERRFLEAAPPASVAMLFQSGGQAKPSIANSAPRSANGAASPPPSETGPTVPPAAPSAPPATAPKLPPPPPLETPPQPATPPPVTAAPAVPQAQPAVPNPAPGPGPAPGPAPPAAAPAPAVPPPLPPVPSILAPPTPAPAAPPLALPQPAAPASGSAVPVVPVPEAKPPPPALALPLPPPPVPAPQFEATRPTVAARHPAPQRQAFAFPAPMDFSLGSSHSAPAARPHQRHPSPGTIDLSFSSKAGGGEITQLHPYGDDQEVGSDWESLLTKWWIEHRYYPDEAVRLDQQGEVTLRVVIAHNGHVDSVDMEKSSGSPWIDLAALGTLRDANLPPLPKDFTDPKLVMVYHLHYILVH